MVLSNVILLTIVVAVSAAPSQDGRIVSGTLAELGEFPYVVSLQYFGGHFCGGSIISEDYVLTAAHCITKFDDHDLEGLQVQYGVINVQRDENMINVKRVIKHQGFNPELSPADDVAVLELSEKIKFGPNAQPVQLPNNDDYPGDNATSVLVGWGQTGSLEPASNELLKVNLILFTHSYCESKEDLYIRESNVCAGVSEGGKGQCSGDSGGPLTVNGVQFGVVSWSIKPCASVGHPGVHTSVVAYRDWIRENSGV